MRTPSVIGSTLNRWRRQAPYRFFRRSVPLRLTQGTISFTFDDAPKSAAEDGADVLESMGAMGTYYVNFGLLGTRQNVGELVSLADVSRLSEKGHEIGCHTYSHPNCLKVRQRDFIGDVFRNQQAALELGFNLRLDNFAFPSGASTLRVKRELRKRFDTLRGNVKGIHFRQVDLAMLYAIPLYQENLDMAEIRGVLERTAAGQGWTIFYTHDVCSAPSRYGISRQSFDEIVLMSKSLGCEGRAAHTI